MTANSLGRNVFSGLRVLVLAALAIGAVAIGGGVAMAKTNAKEPMDVSFSFEGPFGQFDQAELQRGFKVYAEVCSACHSMNLLSYRDLAQPGGPFWDPKHPDLRPAESPYAKAIAAQYKVADIDPDTGDVIQRTATAADHFKAPFANEAAARAANGGALPPDLSVIVRAREGGAHYIYSLLLGYEEAPAGMTVPDGKYYNPFMAGDMSSYWKGAKDKVPEGGFIAMSRQLVDDRVQFDDKTRSTAANEAHAVATFLAWAADPHQVERKQTGLAVMLFLFVLTLLTYLSYRRIWRNVAH
jgi:ubiquinol-cytochrome c reductase cytochrome c1 subunit